MHDPAARNGHPALTTSTATVEPPEFFPTPNGPPDRAPAAAPRAERPNPATIAAWGFLGHLAETLAVPPEDRPRPGMHAQADLDRCFGVLRETLGRSVSAEPAPLAGRRRLPTERPGITVKFDIEGNEGYLIVGLYPDDTPGEIFIRLSKEGSTLGGAIDSWAMLFSLALQNGTPLADLVDKFAYARFEPSGRTNSRLVPECTSVVDFVARLLGCMFVPGYRDRPAPGARAPITDWRPPADPPPEMVAEPATSPTFLEIGPDGMPTWRAFVMTSEGKFAPAEGGSSLPAATPPPYRPAATVQATGPPCPVCGCVTVPAGACHRCVNCGCTTGCG
jgi:ribonucleoside-diphosphate reductase alpha chain